MAAAVTILGCLLVLLAYAGWQAENDHAIELATLGRRIDALEAAAPPASPRPDDPATYVATTYPKRSDEI